MILTQAEKALLREIEHHPHKKYSRSAVQKLYELDLVAPDTDGEDAFHQPIPKDTYCVSDFYWVYHEYRRSLLMDKLLTAFWLPVLVSFVTSLLTTLPQWLPVLLQSK